jgi:hypothetical protein
MLFVANRRKGKRTVQRVDGFYLYEVGWKLHALDAYSTKEDCPIRDIHLALLVAEGALEPFLSQSVFRFRTCQTTGTALLAVIREMIQKINTPGTDYATATFNAYEIYRVQDALKTFEAVLGSELALLPQYLVMKKGAFDTASLVEAGEGCFPDELLSKAPEAAVDAQQFGRCLAFELYTAAGFHLHRLNEAVLRRYFDAVSNGAKRPRSRNMGDYLAAMDKLGVGLPKVKAALTELKDLHRNPLMHPEDVLGTADEAIDLFGAVRACVGAMLKEIPQPTPGVLQGLIANILTSPAQGNP